MFRNQKAWMKAIGIVAILGIVLGNVTPAVLQAHPLPLSKSNPVQSSPVLDSKAAIAESGNRQNAQNAVDASLTDSPALVATPQPIDCKKPLPGTKNRLVADNEIMVGFRDGDNWEQIIKLDNHSPDETTLDLNFAWWNGGNDRDDISWQAMTTADLDADGKAEAVSAFRDGDKTLQVVSLVDAERNSDLNWQFWWDDESGRKGGELSKIDIASGNLDRSTDGSDEVVVAFRDANKDLQVIMFDGTSSGGLTFQAWVRNQNSARGDVKNVSVAAGDLDGDGFDDEIVVAFEDGDDDLQVNVLEYDGDNWLAEKHLDYWTSNKRGDIIESDNPQGIDVATGDVDGDFKDEIAIAFEETEDALQVLVLEDADGNYAERGFWRDENHARNDVWYVSAAMGDIDADGRAEIATTFEDNDHAFQMVTLDAQDNKPVLRGSFWSTSGERGNISWTGLDAGDIDGDGRAEIVAAFKDSGEDLQVATFDGEKDENGNAFDDGDAPLDNGSGIALRTYWENHDNDRGKVQYVGVALGDVDGNTSFAVAQETCQEVKEAHVTAVVAVPPYWEDVNKSGTSAGYGRSQTDSTQEGHSTSKTFASSTTADLSLSFMDIFEVGPSFTYDFQMDVTNSWTKGKSKTVESGFLSDSGVEVYDMVIYDAVTNYCYQYKNTSDGTLQKVCVPVAVSEEGKALEWWNQTGITDGGRTQNQTSWIPAERAVWRDQLQVAAGKWMGSRNQGAGAAIAKINAGDTPDLIWAWIDNPDGNNRIWYRVGGDLASTGGVTSWTADVIKAGADLTSDTPGLGIAVTNLDSNVRPELIVAWVDNPAKDNYAYYRIGWNLGTNGVAASWSSDIQIPGSLGYETQGVGVSVANLNSGDRPDLVFGWIANPSDTNAGYYKVGWDLNTSGKVASWGARQDISGAFGIDDSDLDLAIADLDGSGSPDLVAAWVRTDGGENRLQYSVGYSLTTQGKVGYWAPGQPLPGWVGNETDGAAFAMGELDQDGQNEWLFGWIDDPSGENKGYYRTGQLWQIGGEVDKRPTDVRRVAGTDDYFQVKLEDNWWNVSGNLLWIKDGAQNVGPGSTATRWSVTEATFGSLSEEKSTSHSFTVGGEGKVMGLGPENSETWGWSNGSSYEISWEETFYMEGQAGGMQTTENPTYAYSYKPFSYMQSGLSLTGVGQDYMVVDYVVPMRASQSRPAMPSTAAQKVQGVQADPPAAPVITSTTHISGVWGAANDASFAWGQAVPDPTIAGYRWLLDTTADTVPSPLNLGMDITTTYTDLPDGTYYFHVRAVNADDAWSDTTHFQLKIDANAPQSQIIFDPPAPKGTGWYNTPVTLTLVSNDGNGSGLQAVTYSNDGGVTWQSYTAPLVLGTDISGTVYQFRMTDLTGKIGLTETNPIYIDLTAPTTPVSADCWLTGDCVAAIITNTQGNQVLQLSGQAADLLSGVRGVDVQIDGGSWMVASDVISGEWSLELLSEIGAGYHTINIRAEDIAGNTEASQYFAQVLWLPRSTPDLSASTFYASASKARPGDCVDFTADIRNQAWQESQVTVTVQIPTGFEVPADSISSEGQYHSDSATITWLLDYLWPGQQSEIDFRACVSSTTAAQPLTTTLQLKSQWPNVDQLPAAQQAIFKSMETQEERSVTIQVAPTLPAGQDLIRPHAFLTIEPGQFTSDREIQLTVGADEITRSVFIREWIWSAAAQDWQVDHESQWFPYQGTLDWQLANQEGVHYLGVWVMDKAGNVSKLDDASLKLTNLVTDSVTLGAGQSVQYRFVSQLDDWIDVTIQALSGNPDLFGWLPNNGYLPDLASVGLGDVDSISHAGVDSGVFLWEVQADVDSTYHLMVSNDLFGSGEEGVLDLDQGRQGLLTASEPPVHPLYITDPFSASTTLTPPDLLFSVFLPAVLRQ